MIKLEVGKSYRNRNGDVVKITKFHENVSEYPFACKDYEYTDCGKFYTHFDGDYRDLIEEVVVNEMQTQEDSFEVCFLGKRGFATKKNNHYLATFPNPTTTLMFDLNRKLYGFDSENLLEIIKDQYQVLYRNNHGIYNTTTTKVTNMKEAIGIIEYDNELCANPKKVIGLIDKDGNIIYNK